MDRHQWVICHSTYFFLRIATSIGNNNFFYFFRNIFSLSWPIRTSVEQDRVLFIVEQSSHCTTTVFFANSNSPGNIRVAIIHPDDWPRRNLSSHFFVCCLAANERTIAKGKINYYHSPRKMESKEALCKKQKSRMRNRYLLFLSCRGMNSNDCGESSLPFSAIVDSIAKNNSGGLVFGGTRKLSKKDDI